MSKPKRIQRKRVKGWKLPENAVCVDRSSRWGNPYKVGDEFFNAFTQEIGIHSIEDVLQCFEFWLKGKLTFEPDFLKPLRGKDLACFCKQGAPCHADILLKYANTDEVL